MFEQYIQDRPLVRILFQVLIANMAAFLIAMGLNFFLIPGDIFSSGTSGIAQIINYFAPVIPVIGPFLTVGNLVFILNVPLLFLSWFKIGRDFTLLSLLVVFLSTVFTNIVPVIQVSTNPLLNGIMGGVICGLGSAVAIKFGLSCGGLDIVSLVLARVVNVNIGILGFAINSLIIFASGVLFEWENALYTLISIYVLANTIDSIHTSEQRLTALVVTNKMDEVVNAIYKSIVRGVTILDGQGGYLRDKRSVVMVVINRYELYALQQAVKHADDRAFINIVPSIKVVGHFFSRDQQRAMKKQVQTTQPLSDSLMDNSHNYSYGLEFDQLYENVDDLTD